MSFLRDITSRAGKNLITGPHKTRTRKDGSPIWVEKWVDFADDEATDRAIAEVSETCSGTYFALGAFKPHDGVSHYRRLSANCVSLKAFWFDIDCGEEKWLKHNGQGVYKDKASAQQAFSVFARASGIPYPTYVVNSGAGFHMYWELEDEISITEWRNMALAIKAICAYYEFHADPARTADASSVLRVPGSQHKSGVEVSIVAKNSVVTLAQMNSFIDIQRPLINSPKFQELVDKRMGLGEHPSYLTDNAESTLDQQMLDTPKKFENIIKRCELDNSGCNQILQMYKHQERVPEPMWAGALSIAKFCLDGEEWAIKISENHPEFNPDLTLRKMNQWVAPRTCQWFADANPEGCKGCPHFQGIKDRPTQSPIMLAVDDNRIPTVVKASIAGGTDEQFTEEFIIPAYPFPYYRDPQRGGVWVQGDEGSQCVYDFDLYIYDRIGFGADNKPRFWARQHTPYDGVTELELSSDDLYVTGAGFLQRLAAHNILVPPDKEAGLISRYLRQSVAQLQRSRAMTKPPKQLGWTERGSFVMGRWEYTKAGRKMSPIPDTNIARMFREACEVRANHNELIDGWNRALEKLYGADDAMLYRLILAAGFGSPIRCKYGSEVGGIINIYSEDSGFGKSTLTKVISGIYAQTPDPFFYQARQGTTINAFFEIISYVNSLPMTLDETGQLEVEDLMLFIHTCTSGKAKARSSHQVNDVRAALPGWRTHVFSSSNVSLWNRITEQRAENEAYLMRVVEIPIRALKQSQDKNYGDEAVRDIQQFYGIAGQKLLEYVMQHEDEVSTLWSDVSKSLTTSAQLHGRHRFWGDIMTSAVVGAKIGSDAGVFPFDPKEIYRSACKLLRELVARADGKVVKELDLLGEMMNFYIDSTIVVKSQQSHMALKMPLRKAFMRIEQDEDMLYVDNLALREFAKYRHFGIERLEGALEDVGGRRGVMKRMWDNTEFQNSNPSVKCWEINLADPRMQAFLNRGNNDTIRNHGTDVTTVGQ